MILCLSITNYDFQKLSLGGGWAGLSYHLSGVACGQSIVTQSLLLQVTQPPGDPASRGYFLSHCWGSSLRCGLGYLTGLRAQGPWRWGGPFIWLLAAVASLTFLITFERWTSHFHCAFGLES